MRQEVGLKVITNGIRSRVVRSLAFGLIWTRAALEHGRLFPGVQYTTGDRARSVAIGDLDGDQVPDLAVGKAVSANVSVLLNQSSGDCNGNGIRDECDIDCGPSGGACDLPGGGQSEDCNGNAVPDDCEVDTDNDCDGNGVPDECESTVIYVDDDGPGDPGPGDLSVSDPEEDGSLEHPYDAIQEAIEASLCTGVLVVADGTYTEKLNLLGKPITLRSSDGPAVTTIDGINFVVKCVSGEGPDTVLEGFTITGGMYDDNSTPTVTNCTFSGNTASIGGGGMSNFLGNLTVTNCILWGDSPEEIFNDSSTLIISFSAVQGGWPGEDNIAVDPLFVDTDGLDDVPGTEDDNLRLLGGSPAIDAADNTAVPTGVTIDLNGNPRFVDDPFTPDTGNGHPHRRRTALYGYRRSL